MAVVVDASTIGAIAFGEPEGPTLAAHLKGQTLVAPALVDYEVTNLALKKIRRHPDAASRIIVSLHAALALPLTRVDVPGLDALAIAQHTGLSAYDASYLWLARTRDLELVTLDKRLRAHVPA